MAWIKTHQHLIKAYVWVGLSVPTILWWKDSVLWVAFLSLYANYASEIASHLADKAKREASNGTT